MMIDWRAAALWLGACNLMFLIVLGIHVAKRAKPGSDARAGTWTSSSRARPRCMVHDTSPREYELILRHSTFTVCTCHPIPVADEPPTQPAMPPTRRERP